MKQQVKTIPLAELEKQKPIKKKKISNTLLFEEYGKAKETKNEKLIIKSRNNLIMHNQSLITHVINKYFSKKMIKKSSMEDLLQEGCFGLAEAIERFKPEKGYKFSTYAAWWIRQSVGSALKQKETRIVIPPHIINIQNKYASIAMKEGISFEEALEADVKKGNLSEKMMNSAVAAINSAKVISYDGPTKFGIFNNNEDDSDNFKSKIDNCQFKSETSIQLDDTIDKMVLVHVVKNALENLCEKKRNVLLLRFGIIEEPSLYKK